MKANELLQVIFAIFLGLVVVAFVGIGVNTFYPSPADTGTYDQDAWTTWQLTTSVILLICATVIMVVSLVLPEIQAVLSNGVLMGGVFTMVYAVGMAVFSNQNVTRFIVAAFALAVTVAVGYFKFVRRRQAAAAVAAATAVPITGEVGERIAAIERKLENLGRALRE